MPIIRITKQQIEKAGKAREAALLKDPEYRIYAERQQLQREAASKQNQLINGAHKESQPSQANDQDCRPCDDEREAAPQKMERRS